MTLPFARNVAFVIFLRTSKKVHQTIKLYDFRSLNSSGRSTPSFKLQFATRRSFHWHPAAPLLLVSFPFFKGKGEAEAVEEIEADEWKGGRRNPLPLPDESTLTSSHLVRNSASVTGEDAGNLLALALQKLIDAQKQLESDLRTLKNLIEGLSVAEEKALPDVYAQLWDAVTSQRVVVSGARDRLLESKVLLQLSVNVAAAAAEVAFVADAEFIAASLNDKLNKVELYKRQSEEALSSSELLLAAAEAKLINSTPTEEEESSRDSERLVADRQNAME